MNLTFFPPGSPFGQALVGELGGFGVSDLLSVSGLSSEVEFRFLPFCVERQGQFQ